MPSWHGTQIKKKKHRDNFTFTFHLGHRELSCFIQVQKNSGSTQPAVLSKLTE